MTRARSALTSVTAAVAVALVLGVCMGAYSLTRPVPPERIVTTGAEPTASASPTVPPSTSPAAAGTVGEDALRVFAVGALPPDFRFVLVGDAGDERFLLLDLTRKTVVEAAHFVGPGLFPKGRNVEIASSPDGATAVILLRAEGAPSRLLVIRPVAGISRAFAIPGARQPRISPDGRRIAVQVVGGAAEQGVWIVSAEDGSRTRLVAQDVVAGPPPQPQGWSGDGRWLAVTVSAGGPEGERLGVVDVTAGPTAFDRDHAEFRGGSATLAGPAAGARWRGGEVIHWTVRGGSAVLAAYDVATRATRTIVTLPEGRTITRAEARPAGAEVATLESSRVQELWLRGGTQDRRVADAGDAIAQWWSPDGARLYLWTNDNGTTAVADALTGTPYVKFCLRQRVAPPCD